MCSVLLVSKFVPLCVVLHLPSLLPFVGTSVTSPGATQAQLGSDVPRKKGHSYLRVRVNTTECSCLRELFCRSHCVCYQYQFVSVDRGMGHSKDVVLLEKISDDPMVKFRREISSLSCDFCAKFS